MILVVADTGPINYLVQIGLVDLLGELAETVVLPSLAREELLHPSAPSQVRDWIAAPPSWLNVSAARGLIPESDISNADREAIALAKELSASLLLMDDRQARRLAAAHGVLTIGTLGLLELAAERDLLRIEDALEKLQQTSFYLTEDLVANILERQKRRQHD